MPTTPLSFKCSVTRRKVPAFLGTELSTELNMPIIAEVRVQASDTLRPQASASELSVRSTSIMALSVSMVTLDVMVMPSDGVPGMASWVDWAMALPPGINLIACIMRISE